MVLTVKTHWWSIAAGNEDNMQALNYLNEILNSLYMHVLNDR